MSINKNENLVLLRINFGLYWIIIWDKSQNPLDKKSEIVDEK